MFGDRIKTIFWLGLVKFFQPCLANRKTSWEADGCRSSFVRIGRLDFYGRSRSSSSSSSTTVISAATFATDRRSYDDFVRPEVLQHAFATAGSVWDGHQNRLIRPASTKTRPKPKRSPQTQSVQDESSSTSTMMSPVELSVRVADPIISESVWAEMTGKEFEDPSTVNRLARAGLEMGTQVGKKNAWIHWTAHKDTAKLLQEKDEWSALEDGDVLMYVGKCKKQDGYFGSDLPIIKSKSILPLSAKDMADLLMDSSRVKTYNKLSVGRTDVRIFDEQTKIVCNLTKPPIAKSKMVSITLMHARPLSAEQDGDLLTNDKYKEGYVVVSRAVPGMIDDDLANLPRNDILLGVNILQDIGPDQCVMTAVTHVYSPALPTMLAKKMGVSSAMNFVRDIRDACIPASN